MSKNLGAIHDERLEPQLWALSDASGWTISDETVDPAADKVVVAVRSLEFVNQAEIAARLRMDKSTVSRRIRRATMTGVLKDDEAAKCFERAAELRRSDEGDEDLEDDGSEF